MDALRFTAGMLKFVAVLQCLVFAGFGMALVMGGQILDLLKHKIEGTPNVGGFWLRDAVGVLIVIGSVVLAGIILFYQPPYVPPR